MGAGRNSRRSAGQESIVMTRKEGAHRSPDESRILTASSPESRDPVTVPPKPLCLLDRPHDGFSCVCPLNHHGRRAAILARDDDPPAHDRTHARIGGLQVHGAAVVQGGEAGPQVVTLTCHAVRISPRHLDFFIRSHFPTPWTQPVRVRAATPPDFCGCQSPSARLCFPRLPVAPRRFWVPAGRGLLARNLRHAAPNTPVTA